MMQLHVLRAAKFSSGPTALCNDEKGTPDNTCTSSHGGRGQLVYYFQAADRFKHPQCRDQYLRALLRSVNLSKSAGLHGVLGLYFGMRVRLTKKLLGPELVQEATGEVVGFKFHPNERFGHPASTNLRPCDSHECWQRGWVRCDKLPVHIEVRWDGSGDDYTGFGKPGVWH